MTVDSECSHKTKRRLLLGRKDMTKLDSVLKKQRHHFANKSPYSQSSSSSYVWMWELDHEGVWALKNWCLWTAVLEKTLESPLDCKEIKPVNPKGNQPWILTEKTNDEKAPILWPPIWKADPTWCWERLKPKEKRAAEDKMVRWHHWLNGRAFKQTLGDSEGRGSLVSSSPRSCSVRQDLVTEQQQKILKALQQDSSDEIWNHFTV